MEELRNAILRKMSGKITEEQMQELDNILNLTMYDYHIERKSTELTLFDKSNEIMLKNFLGSKAIEGCSPATLKHYKETIQRMIFDIGKNIKDINTNDIRHHLASWQVNRGVSNTTLNNMRKAYCSFFKWLNIEGYIDTNPMLKISSFKCPKKQIKPFTEREMEKMCSNCTNIRDRALLEFLYSTGCRVTECSNVNFEDIDFMRGTVLIRYGKGNKERVGFISEKCMYWLEKYITECNIRKGALWLGKRGRLTKAGIEYIVRSIGNRAKVDAHPHKYRHTFATDLVKRGAPVQIVKDMLGHEDINTTMIYVTTNNKEVENVHRKLIA